MPASCVSRVSSGTDWMFNFVVIAVRCIVYQKDLGDTTADLAAAMTEYTPIAPGPRSTTDLQIFQRVQDLYRVTAA